MSRSALAIGDAVVDPRELREVGEVDAEHQDEVVGDDLLLEVGARLADLQEVVELGRSAACSGIGIPSRCAAPDRRSVAARLADRLVPAIADRLAVGADEHHRGSSRHRIDCDRRAAISAAQPRVRRRRARPVRRARRERHVAADDRRRDRRDEGRRLPPVQDQGADRAGGRRGRDGQAARRARRGRGRTATGAEAVRSCSTKVIDLAVERRRWVSALQSDPVIIRLLGEHEPFRRR